MENYNKTLNILPVLQYKCDLRILSLQVSAMQFPSHIDTFEIGPLYLLNKYFIEKYWYVSLKTKYTLFLHVKLKYILNNLNKEKIKIKINQNFNMCICNSYTSAPYFKCIICNENQHLQCYGYGLLDLTPQFKRCFKC